MSEICGILHKLHADNPVSAKGTGNNGYLRSTSLINSLQLLPHSPVNSILAVLPVHMT